MTTATKHLCGAVLCGREYSLTATGKIRRHASRTDPEQSCPGSGHPPAASAQEVAQRQDRTAAEWDKALADGERRGEDVEAARASYERALRAWSLPEPVPCPEGMTPDDFEEAASVWLSWQLAERRRGLDRALSFQEIGELRRQRYHAAAQEARIRAAAETAPGADNPMFAKLAKEDSVTQTPPWASAAPALPPPPWLAPPVAESIEKAPPSAEELFATPERAPRSSSAPAQMTDLGAEITARFKEIFFAYINRDSADNRSAQKHLGPSGIGTPCDRRIALELMDVPACNPGLDGWSSFVGTAVHDYLAKMFTWANHGTGRYATEVGLDFPVALMPHGTTDLIDRVLLLVDDHKVQGATSADELRKNGPAPYYRVQAHTYAYGARLKGEEIEHVAITSWPRDRSTLKNLYTWTEPYDESIALEAIARVEGIEAGINAGAQLMDGTGDPLKLSVSQRLEIGRRGFTTADACKFCEFHAPGDKLGERGCQGYGK